MNDRHEHHHQLLENRRSAWLAAPKRTQVQQLLHKRLGQQYYWTLDGHLHGGHNRIKFTGPPTPLEELERLHNGFHAEDQTGAV